MRTGRDIRVFVVVACLGVALVAAVGTEVRPWKPAGISSPRFESHAAIDPRTGDFYFVRSSPQFTGWRILVSRCTGTGWSAPAGSWTPRTKLGPEVNQDAMEIGALFSPSGRSLLFARDTKGTESGEFFVWYEHGPEAWPPECPTTSRIDSRGAAPARWDPVSSRE